MANVGKTKVIFRKFKDNGDIIALFPEIVGSINAYCDCESYMQKGQHGPASLDIVHWTIPASKLEYVELQQELISLGYNLTIIKRFNYFHTQKRLNALKIRNSYA